MILNSLSSDEPNLFLKSHQLKEKVPKPVQEREYGTINLEVASLFKRKVDPSFSIFRFIRYHEVGGFNFLLYLIYSNWNSLDSIVKMIRQSFFLSRSDWAYT